MKVLTVEKRQQGRHGRLGLRADADDDMDRGAAAGLEVVSTHVLDHGAWSYTTVLARATGAQQPRPTDPESLEISWVPTPAVADRPLLVAFGRSWPTLRPLVEAL